MQDARDGAVAGRTAGADAHHAVAGYHARQHLVAALDGARHALARQCRRVEGGSQARQGPVDGYAFAGLDLDDVAHLDLGRVDGHRLVVADDRGMVGTEGDERLDVAACTAHGTVLQGLADAVECHHGDRFGVFADGKGSDAGHRHEQELAEYFALTGLLDGLAQHAQSRGQPGGGIPCQPHPAVGEPAAARCRHDDACNQQNQRQCRFPPAHLLLMLVVMSITAATAAVVVAFFLVMMFVVICHCLYLQLFVFLAAKLQTIPCNSVAKFQIVDAIVTIVTIVTIGTMRG